MNVDTAAEYALTLDRTRPGTADDGAASVSALERELVTLAAQGRTDARSPPSWTSASVPSGLLDCIRDKTAVTAAPI